ncbi:MAG TPA: MBL fold metallo-hydrolase RNA specificity domain-containing protein [Mycobacteriales bacterium]
MPLSRRTMPRTPPTTPDAVRRTPGGGGYSLGAHASADELVGITAKVDAGEVMLVHGEPSGQDDLRARLSLRRQPTADTLEWTAPTRCRTGGG